MRFFGVLCLKSDYTDMVGLRNSHDKRFPCAVSLGSKVFVYDNLAFVCDHVIKRKHTANLKPSRSHRGDRRTSRHPARGAEEAIRLLPTTALTDDRADAGTSEAGTSEEAPK